MIALPDINDLNKVADWVELYVISKNEHLSKAALMRLMMKEVQDWDEEQVEPLVDSVFNELDKRVQQYGNVVHYQINGKTIIPLIDWKNFPELTMCLIFSIYGVRKKKGRDDGTKYFELITEIAVKTFLGCKTIVLGFPSKSKLINQVQDFIRDSHEEKGRKNPRSKDKDKGVDIIAWKPFDDMRSNQLLLFIQCGAGLHAGSKKPINVNGWKRIIDFAVDPVTCIAIPSLINEDDIWEEFSDYYNIIFDRIRLAKNISGSAHINTELRKKITKWCDRRINQ